MNKNKDWYKQLREELFTLGEKVDRKIEADYDEKGCSQLEGVLDKIDELRKEVRKLDPHGDVYEPIYTESEQKLKDISDTCNVFAKELLDKICKRAIREMNKWGRSILESEGNFPSNFNVFDILSVELQTNFYSDINPFLEDAIENVLWTLYEELSNQERFFIENSDCFYEDSVDPVNIMNKLHGRFWELLNEHWATSKKIQDYELKL